MAENQAFLKPDEREIPVFTVLKNNCILKNIYLLDNPPSFSSSPMAENAVQESDIEETLLVGRHPDCNIKLEHPSISRFHLRIHSKPSSRSLYITDLSSVHGTWISGKKVEPDVRTKLNEGDTLQLGGSSRLYRLHWVPFSRAYDTENPFVPQMDTDTVEEEIEELIHQYENSLSSQNEQLHTLSEENLCLSMKKLSPSTPLKSKDLYDSFSDEEEELENKSSPCDMYEEHNEISQFEEKSSTPEAFSPSSGPQTASQIENMENFEMESEKKPNLSIWSRRGKSKSVKIETNQSGAKSVRSDSNVKSMFHENCGTELNLENQFACPDHIFTPGKENLSPSALLSGSLKKKSGETLKSGSILNTPISSLDLDDDDDDDDDDEVFTPDKENMTPNTRLLRSMKNMDDVKCEKSYKSSPLKKNCKSNMHEEKLLFLPSSSKEKQHGNILQERKSANSAFKIRYASLKKEKTVIKNSANREPFQPLSITNCNNKASSQPSIHITAKSSKSFDCLESEEVIHPPKKMIREKNKMWNIIVDTGCLLNKKSRKELQLLRGLKGTSLLVSRIVVRELDCMLKRGSLFRRTTDVSEALEWIEDCMKNTTWWIHVQNSAEEGSLIPPTPPSHWFNDDKTAFKIGSIPFSPSSLQEIVTPTAEDHILEYALLFKRTRNDGQPVILSNDVTLKIKAMSEGVICETAEDFRRSLVNPFSERFLYNGSSPRGPTWSCEDDAVLKEKYYPSPSKKLLSKSGGVKGLKLILQHNSNFKQITPFS